MASNLDTSASSGSLTARRPAATNLGSMSLPPLPFRQNTPQKPMALYENSGPHQTSTFNAGNLLTPPSNGSDTMSPLTGIVNGGNGQSLQTASPGGWPQNATSPIYGMAATGITPPSWSQGKKGPFSPPLADVLQRTNTNSPGAQDVGHAAPLNDLGAFTNNISPSLNAVAAANQQAFAQNNLLSGVSQPSAASDANNGQTSLSSPPLQGMPPGFMDRPSSTPNNYPFTSMSQPGSTQTNGFNFNSASSPSQQPPLSAPLVGRNNFSPSPTGAHPQYPLPNAQMPFNFRSPYAFGMPGHNGGQMPVSAPMMTNMHHPNHPMSLIGVPSGIPPMMSGYHSGHAAQLYGAQQHPTTNERPFKCDVCPQSFNRNHDLKRHKRIHLAVKPFPCGHCDKSFSRKDALKRHILVKGCGKSGGGGGGGEAGREDRINQQNQHGGGSSEAQSPDDETMDDEEMGQPQQQQQCLQ